jgi:hypothetical protein
MCSCAQFQIKKALRGVKVEVTHRGNMRRKYRIAGLTSLATRELTYGHSLFFMHSRVYIFPLCIIVQRKKKSWDNISIAKRSLCYLLQFSC